MIFSLIYGKDLGQFPRLADQMLCDRASTFKERLGWDLATDEAGRETDEYDAMNPLYLILGDENGDHLGSTRLMPTTGRTMIADHFAHLTDGVEIESPLIWETTRLFIARRGELGRRAAAALMWAGCKFALQNGIAFFVGVAPAHMVKLYAAGGWKPEVIGEASGPDGDICACLWEVSEEVCEELAKRAGIEEGRYTLSVYRPEPKRKTDDWAPVPANLPKAPPAMECRTA